MAEPFERARALASRGTSILLELDVSRAMREIVVLTLWARRIEHFEATIFLTEMGMVTPGKVAFRALLESMITINAVAKDDDVLKGYLDDDKIQQRKLIKKARDSSDPKYREHIDSEQEANLLKSISETKAKEQSTLELAKKAGPVLYEWYLIVYSPS